MEKMKKCFILLIAAVLLVLLFSKLAGGTSRKKESSKGNQEGTIQEENGTREGETGKNKKENDKTENDNTEKNNIEKNNTENNKAENDKTENNKTENKTKNKKQNEDSETKNSEKKEENQVQESPLRTSLPEGVNYDALPNKKNAWWFIRNKEHQPSGCDGSIDVKKYNAYYLGNTKEKVIYFTFDCGYDNGYTEKMLDVLKKHNAKACFFVTQTYIRDYPEIVKRMKEEGHLVGNHTVTHQSQPSLSTEVIENELATCSSYMKEATGYDMDPFFRPPMGEYSERTLQITKDMGYRTVFWSIAYLDYEVNNQPGSDYVEEHFRTYYHNGAIPLMHNISSANYNALDGILTFLEKEGFRFGTLYELEELEEE